MRRSTLLTTAGIAALGLAWGFSGAFAGAPAGAESAQPNQDMGMQLVKGLRATEGCLGADAGAWGSGKNTIIGWFENKAAVERWYYSETHTGFMGAVGGDSDDDSPPLAHIKDEDTPILVMATISFGGRPALPDSQLPFSQISIELFQPLPGGAHINGRLAPEGFKVAHMRDLTPGG